MKRSILALASGAFILGAAEFVMMGILPQTATAMHVSIPAAGHYISAYAIGVCVGTLILVFGRKVPPKHLIILFMAIALVGNTLSAVSFCSPMLLVARFISGLPHGAFFGTATLIAKTLADKGKEAQSVSMMVMGQTVANMLGVPAGTLLAEAMSWRLAFAILAAWALMTIVVVILWVPSIDPIKDAGIKGQFRFLTHPGPWLILLAVFFGNSGIFCWWSYVSPWLQKTGGWSATMVPILMVLAGLGMVVGGIVGGRLTDLWKAGATAALSHGIALCGLLLVFLLPGNHATTALLTFIIGFALFFNSSPQQLLMVQTGEGGGELAKQLVGRTYDMSYPGVVAIYLTGKPAPGVGPHDVALALVAATYANGYVKNKVMEFVGPGVANLSADCRNGIDVMTTETTCWSSIWQTDDTTKEYFVQHGRPEAYKELKPADVAYYDGCIELDLSTVECMIALPMHPSYAYPIRELKANAKEILQAAQDQANRQLGGKVEMDLVGKICDDGRIYVDQGVVAGCSGGTYENICAVADIIKGKSCGNGEFKFSVYPDSMPTYLELVKNGAVADIVSAGGIFRECFCGPCFGAGDTPANGEFSIRHTTRNFPNREGSKPGEGQISAVALMDARSIAATAANG